MLPKVLEKKHTLYKQGKEFDDYLKSIGDYANKIDKAFLTQICFEHFEFFNNEFPFFEIDSHFVNRIFLSAKEVHKSLRYKNNDEIDFFSHLVDANIKGNFVNHDELKYCLENLCWSFPPVIVSEKFGIELGGENLGKPYHLIEGCHRVSYINRLYELGKISRDSTHEFIILEKY